jgi:hypothetical protein
MSEWASPHDLAAAELPQVPWNKSPLLQRARREGWSIRPAKVCGQNGIEIAIASLPEAAQEAWKNRKLLKLPAVVDGLPDEARRPPADSSLGLEAAAGDTPRKASRAEIDAALRRWRGANKGQLERARRAHQAVLIVRQILAEDEDRRRRGEPTVGRMRAYHAAAIRIYGDHKRKKRVEAYCGIVQGFDECYSLMALVDRKKESRKASQIESDPELKQTIIGIVIYAPNAPRVTIPQIIRKLKKELPDRRVTGRQIGNFVLKWKRENFALYLATTNPREHNNRCLTAIGNLADAVSYPNQQVVSDYSPGDIELLKDGRRVKIGFCKDRYTRQMKLRACDGGPSAEDTIEMYVDWTLQRGFIEIFVPDRGKEFLNERFERGCADMGTRIDPCNAYAAWEKGDVERDVGTVQRRIAELPGSCGPNVAIRQELRERLTMAARRGLDDRAILGVQLTLDQFKVELQRIEDEINNSYHSGLGMSPNAFAAQYVAEHGGPARFDDEPTLRMIFGKGDFRVVGKEGIAYESIYFWCNELIPFIGRRVFVIETSSMGLLTVLSEDRTERIGVAINAERADKDRREMAISARSAQRRFVSEGRAALKSVRKKIKPHVVADAINEIMPSSPAPTPLRSSYPTPQAAAAAMAARALQDSARHLSLSSRQQNETTTNDSAGTAPIHGEIKYLPSDSERRFAEWKRLSAIPVASRTPVQISTIQMIESSREFKVRARLGAVA